jgi:glycosyltransferase involved in cell wall biosynthesis
MKLSIVVPALNEEEQLPRCLACLKYAVATLRLRSRPIDTPAVEVIVVDNNSSDATAEIARRAGARVVFEPVNQISRARNAGAAAATGDWLLFMNADSYVHPQSLEEMIEVIASGDVAGGGCIIEIEGVPPWATACVSFLNLTMRAFRWTAGSFLFCRSHAFRELGGFSTELFGAEDAEFGRRLHRWARSHGMRTRLLSQQVHASSGRKLPLCTEREVLEHLWSAFAHFDHYFRDRRQLGWYYDGRR